MDKKQNDQMSNSETIDIHQQITDILEKHGEPNTTAYYYIPVTDQILSGKILLPHNEPNELRYFRALYIGGKEEYDLYVKKLGITKFFSNGSSVACVGFNPEKEEYYGWSHRGWGKFSLDMKPVKKGSMLHDYLPEGTKPETLQHAKVMAHIFAYLLD